MTSSNLYQALFIIIIIILIYIMLVDEIIRDEVVSWMVKIPIEATANFDDLIIVTFKEDIIAKDIIIEVFDSTDKDADSTDVDTKDLKYLAGANLVIYHLATTNDKDNVLYDLGELSGQFRNKHLRLRGPNSIIGRGIGLCTANEYDNPQYKTIIGYSKII